MYEINQALTHANKMYPQESCGLIVGGKYIISKNIHSDPENHFEISSDDYLKVTKKGTIQAIIHSHPDGLNHPTYTDMVSQIASDVPWCILPHGKVPFWFGDGVSVQPLLKRQFRHGVTDCYSLIRDWYKLKLDIILPVCPRDFEWWDKDQDLYIDNFKDAGFVQIPISEIKYGDVLLASVLSAKINHGAIFLGDNTIMHHLVNRLSVREPLTRWIKYFTIALRYSK